MSSQSTFRIYHKEIPKTNKRMLLSQSFEKTQVQIWHHRIQWNLPAQKILCVEWKSQIQTLMSLEKFWTRNWYFSNSWNCHHREQLNAYPHFQSRNNEIKCFKKFFSHILVILFYLLWNDDSIKWAVSLWFQLEIHPLYDDVTAHICSYVKLTNMCSWIVTWIMWRQ